MCCSSTVRLKVLSCMHVNVAGNCTFSLSSVDDCSVSNPLHAERRGKKKLFGKSEVHPKGRALLDFMGTFTCFIIEQLFCYSFFRIQGFPEKLTKSCSHFPKLQPTSADLETKIGCSIQEPVDKAKDIVEGNFD